MSAYSTAVLADHPDCYYRLGESAGAVAVDSSGNGHNATYVTPVAMNVAGALVGDPDGAVQLGTAGAASGYLTIPTNAFNIGTGDFSLECWYKPLVTPIQDEQLLFTQNGFNNVVRIVTRNDPPALLFVDFNDQSTDPAGGQFHPANLAALAPNVFWHIVCTFGAATGRARVYLNGTLGLEISAGPNHFYKGATPWDNALIGNSVGGPALHGMIDEVALYLTELPAASVALHYAIGTGRGCGSGFPAVNHHQRACVGFESVT